MDPEIAPMVEGVRLDFRDAVGAREFTRAVLAESNRSELVTSLARLVATSDRLIPGSIDGHDLPIRVYRPAEASQAAAAMLFLHGGGFILGDLDHDHVACLQLATATGCVVVSVDYRLAPEEPFPAAVADCYTTLAWTWGHADELGIDGRRLAVGGSSAGGGLAAAVALMARDRGGPPLTFQLLIYPMLDDRMESASMREFAECDGWNASVTAQCWHHYLGDLGTRGSPYAAPARAMDLTGLPGAYVLVAELDPLRDEDLAYAQRLMHAGVPTELHCFPDVPHGFDIRAPDAVVSRQAHDEIALIARRALE
jgi:acetyl esterase/lipase